MVSCVFISSSLLHECACLFTASKPKIEIIRNLRDIPASIPAQNSKNSTASDISTQPMDVTYANVTVANLHQPPCESSNESINNLNGGAHLYDFTVIYEDPTSSSYVVGVLYTCRSHIPIYHIDIYIHCSLRCTPVEVCLTLLGHMCPLWYALYFNAFLDTVCWDTILSAAPGAYVCMCQSYLLSLCPRVGREI